MTKLFVVVIVSLFCTSGQNETKILTCGDLGAQSTTKLSHIKYSCYDFQTRVYFLVLLKNEYMARSIFVRYSTKLMAQEIASLKLEANYRTKSKLDDLTY